MARRTFLGGLAASCLPCIPGSEARAEAARWGPDLPFSFDALTERAELLSRMPYVPPERPSPDLVQRIDYDAHGQIRYRREAALFGQRPGAYPVTFFPLGRFFPKRIRMYAVDAGRATEIRYDPSAFEIPDGNVARRLGDGAGFAGFRVHESREQDDWRTQDWVAFLGASYFRAIGGLGQYGISARGIAIDTATAGPEEFPDFVEFFLEPAAEPGAPMRIHALLDGPSITGAYAFVLSRTDAVVMDVDKRLFLRRDVRRLGVAPLTSMYWYSETNRTAAFDWRPEVHDSDGLAIWTGAGERLWRPLNNPGRVVTSSFLDSDPKGFGLLQRDRSYGHYLDGVNYHLRPSLWVEPRDDWGAGSVQLVEIPTDDEIHDNIVAFWNPARAPSRGSSFTYRYRLHWAADAPDPAGDRARVLATRRGRGGEPGTARPEAAEKFVVEFGGGPLHGLPAGSDVEAVVTPSSGTVGRRFVEPVGETGRWRLVFDFHPDGREAAEIRAFLAGNGRSLSETWLFQHQPG